MSPNCIFRVTSNYGDNCLDYFMISKKHLARLLVKSTFGSLFAAAAAAREFDKLFTLSLSKSNSEFAFPPQ